MSRNATVSAASKLSAANQSDRIVKALSLCLFVLSTGFFSAVTAISYMYPGYFDRLLIERMARIEIDPIAVGSTAKAENEDEKASDVAALPVPVLVRPWTLKPQDFSIVMVYGGEAHLASPGEALARRCGLDGTGPRQDPRHRGERRRRHREGRKRHTEGRAAVTAG
ncbi:hypothetical protein [Jiella pelagia]|uniref:Uncharacterized protein n=1 Tax=Jiella pelagia TaxID=2986949 RepID=A0ABY7BUQ8_9HYPH|nr:hypothetical protein [Jiella pelagia]WAP67529.1 hypothetical protein OH818_18715 [Jiella pelagia]